tara:strand:+ start:364 stop:756 length:393 start_codon:yes stop_codon:yes gene_type:complete
MPVTFPARNLFLEEADEELKSFDNQVFYLEFDGYSSNGVEDWDLELSEVGAEMVKVALCTLPIKMSSTEFWGYNGCPTDKVLRNCEPPEVGEQLVRLTGYDEMALIAVADLLSDARCWQPGHHTANATGA